MINLPESKKYLVQSRLKSRLRDLGILTFQGYCDFPFSEKGLEERQTHLIIAISTNKTDFFRENEHFEFLEHQLLPVLCQQSGRQGMKFLSAGSASGEEAYSLAMLVEGYLNQHHLSIPFMVYGVDVSDQVLKKARKGIYPFSKANEIPRKFLRPFVLKSKDKEKPQLRIAPEIRIHTNFFYQNLMDDSYHLDHDMDVIFCRNTLIYFEKKNQEAIVRKLLRHLKPGGYLFVGHSESLVHMQIDLRQIKPTIYQK